MNPTETIVVVLAVGVATCFALIGWLMITGFLDDCYHHARMTLMQAAYERGRAEHTVKYLIAVNQLVEEYARTSVWAWPKKPPTLDELVLTK